MSTKNTKSTAKGDEKNQSISLPKLLILVGILLALTAPALKGWRVYRSATALQTRIDSIQTMADGGLSALDANMLKGEVLKLRTDSQALHSELESLLPYTPWLTWLPQVGDLMPVMPELLRLLDNGTAIGADLGVELLPIIPILQDDSKEIEAKVPDILRVVDLADGSLERTAILWPTVYDDLEAILGSPAAREALPWQLRQQLPTIEPLLPLVPKGIESLRILPEVAAQDGQRAYLIVGQNSDELRPTGGFLSMTMAVGLESGQIKGLKTSDANIIDNYFEKPYGDPPSPLREFMGSDLFLFRDSNYWPDFPTSSRKMIDLYTYGTGLELDGVIAVDIHFISQLIGAIGPVEIPELGFTLTGDNTLEVLEQAWGEGLELENRFVTRKDFLSTIAEGLTTHLQSPAFKPDIAALATLLDQSFRDKSLQVYIDSAEEKEAFAKLGINGAINHHENEDIVLLSQNNVGFNKSNRMLETSLAYSVLLNEDGSAEAQFNTTWSHAGDTGKEFCEVSYFAYSPGLVYSDMIQGCNWNHIRLYTPFNSRLIDSSVYPIEADKMVTDVAWPGETREAENDLSEFTVFENLRLLPSGQTSDLEIKYALDSVVQTSASGDYIYRLNLVRQAGVYPYPPTTLAITIPEGRSLISSSVEPTDIDGQTITISTTLSENQVIEIVFQ